MTTKDKSKDLTNWTVIKDRVYGKDGSERRDNLNRDFESFKIGLLIKKARETRQLTQEQLGQLIDKKRSYISRIENNGGNITLSTLYQIVEKGFGGKVKIEFEF